MAKRKTTNLLPIIFQTETNQKFLSATLDQLVSEPELKDVYGYIGRKFAPTYKSGDSYIIEPTQERQDCQLEPSIRVKDEQEDTVFFSTYPDFLNKVKYYGGFTNNHDRLFNNQYYSFDPKVSFDKFVNFGQYYWLPDGPDAVEVNTTGVELTNDYTVTRLDSEKRYDFSSDGQINNTLILARGGVYTFSVNQTGHNFWIQSELGIDGKLNATPTISSREVLGVTNNGTDAGTITFTVPQKTAQDRFLEMNQVAEVEYAAPLLYSDLHNQTLTQFLAAFPQYAGITGSLDGKKLIFIGQENLSNVGEEIWTAPQAIDNDGNPLVGWGEGEVVPEADRFGVWKVQFINAGIGDPLLRLVPEQAVAISEKVFIKYGVLNANKEYYRDFDGFFKQMPVLTSLQDTLYIQDGTEPGVYAFIKIVDYNDWEIDVDNDIIGQQAYTSPNGVKFTSGMKIRFDTDVTPAQYREKEYYVEQVGDIGGGIRLVDVDLLVTPETYNDELAINYPDQIFPDYITINKSSKDLNAWSRANRWTHKDVIVATAEYNNTEVVLDNDLRARRPILQFDADLQLVNYGRIGKTPIDILDTDTVDPFEELDGKVLTSAFGVELVNGMRVVFGASDDPLVLNKIYVLSLVQYDLDENNLPSGPKYIKLTKATDGDIEIHDCLVVLRGQYKGSQWHYDGTQWLESQQKTGLQQDPKFDVFDSTGKSFTTFTRSSFEGTSLFGYRRNTAGVDDAVLGFPLSYRNFETQGDIEFSNYFTTDTFSYVEANSEIVKNISTGFLHKIIDRNNVSQRNTWITVTEESRQYQLLNFVSDGSSNSVLLDVTPKTQNTIPYVKVYLNGTFQTRTQWSITGKAITLTKTLVEGDQVDVLVYSDEISKIGHYQVALNIDLNAQNTDITTLTLGQIRNHVIECSQNSLALVGDILGTSNLRDVDLKQQGGTILQHSAPLPYAELFLVDDETNFVDSMRFAQKEYTKFKNKFLELSTSLSGINPIDPVASVELILTELNKLKNKSFPWFYSDMVPYNTLQTVINYTVFDTFKLDYELDEVFNDQQLSSKAVLVYLNDIQLVKDRDYVFRDDRPAVTINVTLTVDDVIKIVQYSNTDGNYIPETPTKLGLWPKYVPEIYTDDTYRTPIEVIRGHDGSVTPAFGDYRDDFLLELEKRIFNNIKIPDTKSFEDVYSVIPGAFRDSDYTVREISRLMARSFLSWVGNNKLDFSSNSTFLSNDQFTWNYSEFVDRINGEYLPGSWRACFEYFYDTTSPHLTPWEMLGFSVKPTWWEDYYGVAPYTGGNKLLWDDLEAGRIVDGERAGIDLRFARPGLSQIIPVDINGFLKNPGSLLARATNTKRAAGAWSVGQQGPTEYAWRKSSDFPFAVQYALAMAKPAQYFSLLADTYNYSLNTDIDQYVTASTLGHLKQNDIKFNGHVNATTLAVTRGAGYLNWIADYLVNMGIDPATKINLLVENYEVNLAYKIAGFTDKKYLNILAEQNSPSSTNDSIIVPDENYNVFLYKSTPIRKIVYSGVIIEKTTNGYSVRGYNTQDPYFTIIPSVVNSNSTRISVLDRDAVIFRDYKPQKLTVPYGYEFTTTQQVVDFLISYERFLRGQGFSFLDMDEEQGETKNFTLSAKEFLYWIQQGWESGSVLMLSPVSSSITALSSGSIADEITDSQYGTKVVDQNFKLVKKNNYNILRSPTEFKLTLSTADSVIGYAEIDLVQYEHVLIFDNVTVFDDIIYKPELGNRQFRLKLIGKKTDLWDGSLSAPGFMYSSETVPLWQQGKDYLKGDLIEFKNQYYVALENVIASTEFEFRYWKLVNPNKLKEGLIPNFATIANDPRSYYDAYPIVDELSKLDFGHGLIGYRPRQYLTDLGVNETTQIEFYKGFIKQKGTKNAINQMLNTVFNNLTSDVNYYEEWAVRVGEFGALDSNPYVEIPLDESEFSVNPSIAQFVELGDTTQGDGVTIFNNSQLYRSTDQYRGNIALNRTDSSDYSKDVPTAGYVNIDDVDTSIFDLANYGDLDDNLNDIGSGYTIWVAKDFTQQWNVYRITETNNEVIEVSNELDGYISFRTRNPHGLSAEDIFLVKSFGAEYDGFYQVYQIKSLDRVMVQYKGNPQDLANLTTQGGDGWLFVLNSLRFQFMESCREYSPPNGWKVGEIVWIDEDAPTTVEQGQPVDTENDTWKVYEKTQPWNVKQTLDLGETEYLANDGFGTSVRMSADGLFSVTGNPQTEVYKVILNSFTSANIGDFLTQPSTGANLTILQQVSSTNQIFARYNSSAELNFVANVSINGVNIGTAPNESTRIPGTVNTFFKDRDDNFVQGFSLVPDAANVAEFGQAVDLAVNTVTNTHYLAGGAPGSNSNIGYVVVYDKTIESSAFTPRQIIYGNLSAAGDRFGSSLAFDESGDWLYVGAPDNDTVYIYGLDRFVPQAQQQTSVNNENILILDSNVAITSGDIIRQPATGAEAIVLNTSASTGNLEVTTLSNFQTTVSGNLFIDGSWVSGNIAINSASDSGVYPTGTDSYSVTDEIDITFALHSDDDDANSLLVRRSNQTYIPDVDYTLDSANVKIVFTDGVIEEGDITIIQRPYYKLLNSITAESGIEFGYAVDSSYDGAQLAVGTPNDTVNVGVFTSTVDATDVIKRSIAIDTNTANVTFGGNTYDRTSYTEYQGAGSVYVYDRVIEAFKSDGSIDYTTQSNIASVYKVTIDDIEVNDYTITGTNSIRFIDPPDIGKVIFIETNEFNLLEKLIGVDSLEGGLDNIQADARFGTDLTICSNNCAIYVGAPNYDAGTSYNTGAVWKFHNKGRLYGINTGQELNPTFTPGDTIRLDNFEVEVTGTTLDDFVDDVNNANILGVTAHNENGLLRLESDKTVAKNLLRILSGQGTVLEDAGMAIFAFMQIIINPFDSAGEGFGTKVKLAPNAYMLVIGAKGGTTRALTTFDTTITTFDLDSTRCFDSSPGSGSVYLYELYDDPRDEVENPGRYQYAQQLITENLGNMETGEQFGFAIDIEANYILVSSPTDNRIADSSGSVYVFDNPTNARGWKLIRYQQDKVDIDSVNRMYLYDKTTNTILTNLQFIDPVKGKILGEADQEITYKTEYDPAKYNRGSRGTSNAFWGDQQVGKVWWNLNQVRFTDYEQDTLTYRSINWGNLFPGSIVEVCEWVKSDVLPSQYVANGGDGVPKYADDSAYVEIIGVDPITNIIDSTYYYWVTGKTTVDPNDETRNLPLESIQELIRNPKGQGVPYAAVIREDAVILYNVSQYLSDVDTILHIDYEFLLNDNIIHSEYQLVQKNNPNDFVPDKIVNKFIDSLAGEDRIGRVVPDPTLSLADRYGILSRPRQSIFINRLEAMENLIDYVNKVLIQYPVARQYDLSRMLSEEAEPNFKLGEYHEKIATEVFLEYIDTTELDPGHLVLVENDTTQDGLWVLYELSEDKEWTVKRVQSYKTSLYWNYVDWYAEGYDATEQIEFVVDTLPDALKLAAAPGDEILVRVNNSDRSDGWNLLTVLNDGTFEVVGIENGTLQLSDDLGNFVTTSLGFGNQRFDEDRYDQNPNRELREILFALKDSIFVDNLQGEFNKLFFVLVNYLFSEQKFVDWIFKTSFVSVTHKLRSLTQFPSYIEDNQTYYQTYIEEVKPYRTKIREYLINYNANDQVDGDLVDFDLPAYYDEDLKVFRSPSGEQSKDTQLWVTDTYSSWYNNRTFEVESISVTNGGSGYTTPPTVTIITSGQGGSGATATAVIDGDTGSVIRIDVTNSGSGYVRTPTVIINGSNTTPATAYAHLANKKVRTFDSALKFDRISYLSTVQTWAANTSYTAGDIITHVSEDGIRKAWLVTSNITTGNSFVSSNYTLYSPGDFNNANDRIIAYYQPGTGMPGRDLNQLIYGIEYPGVQVKGADFSVSPLFDGAYDITSFDNVEYDEDGTPILGTGELDTVIRSTYSDTSLGLRPEDIDVDGGAYVDTYSSHAPEELVPGITFDTIDMRVYTKINSNVDVLGYRIFGNMMRENKYFRIADSASTVLARDLSLTDTRIYVTDATKLPTPSRSGEPGVVFIGSERITYYRNYANENTPWASGLRYAEGDVVSYSGSYYVALVDTQETTFPTDDFELLDDINILTQIRRGTQGTGTATVHRAGWLVIDGSLEQEVPGTVEGNIVISSNTEFNASDTVTYIVELSGNISANVGDYITQNTSGTNATVLGTSSGSTDELLVVYNNSNRFNLESANVGVTSNIAINGTYTGNIYPTTSTVAGKVEESDGNVIITTESGNVTLTQANVWYNLGFEHPTDQTGFEGATTIPVLFLKDETANSIVVNSIPDPLVTEDAINILITEDGSTIFEEDQE